MVKVLKACKGQETSQCERSREDMSEGVIVVSVGTPRLRFPWREVKPWHHVPGSESLETAPERQLVKGRPVAVKTTHIGSARTSR